MTDQEQASIEEQTTEVQSESILDLEIRPGDVVVDLAQCSFMQVVSYLGDVEDHRELEDYDILSYESNLVCGASEADEVYKCVYIGGDLKSMPSGTYDFPSSRLARYPVEEANESIGRVQTGMQRSILLQVLANLPQELRAEVVDEAVDDLPMNTVDDVVDPVLEELAKHNSEDGEDEG